MSLKSGERYFHGWPADGKVPVPGDGAGDPAGRPPEGPGREGRVGGAGSVLGPPPDRGEETDPCLFILCFHFCFMSVTCTHTQSQ